MRTTNDRLIHERNQAILAAERAGNDDPLQGQLRDVTATYITSIDPPDEDRYPGWKSGVTILFSTHVAALRIVEKTHRVSTAKDIAEYHALMEDNRRKIEAEGDRLRHNRVTYVAPAPVQPGPRPEAR